jgi:hypothetical protein
VGLSRGHTPPLEAYSSCKVSSCGIHGGVVGGFSTTLDVYEGKNQLIVLVVLNIASPS